MNKVHSASLLVVALASFLVLLSLLADYGSAFETPTHARINVAAAKSSPVLDQFLRSQLDFLRGLDEPLQGRAVVDWIGLGGVAEDQFLSREQLGGALRSPKHFHTPLRSWDLAGLQGTNEASVRWAQDPGQSIFPSQQAAWADARAAFFRATTARTDLDHQQGYADTFRILGQLMHLVADLASPAHTRDESHALGDPFETFMNDPLNRDLVAGYETFDPGIVHVPPTPDPVAKVPIARIWDTDLYTGANPPDEAASPMFGLAEFTSANFFSAGTIEPTAFANSILPLPAVNLLDLASIEPYNGVNRQYYGKSGDGVPLAHMVAERALHRFIPTFLQNKYVLDDRVLQDYAAYLLPRAIGYSSGLLDYFFRGRLEIAAPDRFVYGRTNYREPFQAIDATNNVNAFTQLRFKVRNATPNETTSCPDGQTCAAPQLIAVVLYRTGGGVDLVKAPQTPPSGELSFAVSRPMAFAPTTDFQELTFDFSDSPLPANVADVFLTVVYRGPLGLEADAIAAGGRDLFEPTPVDFINGTDYFCYNNALQHVSDFGAWPPFDLFQNPINDPPQPRDPNGDGAQDIFGPLNEFTFLVKAADSVTNPSVDGFDQQVSQRSYAQYTRFLVLQDQPVFVLSEFWGSLVETGTTPTLQISNAQSAYLYDANLNHIIVLPDGTLGHEYIPSGSYRGLVTMQFLVLVPQTLDDFLPCAAESFTKEAVTRIEATLAGP